MLVLYKSLNSTDKSGKYSKESYLYKHQNDIYHEIINFSEYDIHFKEKCYLYLTQTKLPHCYCGEELGFKNTKEGYNTYCSNKCMTSSPNIKDKISKTNNLRYGGNPLANKEIRIKRDVTMLEKYGSISIFNSEIYKSKLIEETGYDHPSKVPSVREKWEETMILNHGTVNIMESNIVKQTILDKYGYDHRRQLE